MLTSVAVWTVLAVVVGWVATLYLASAVADLRPWKVAGAMIVLSACALAGARLHYALLTATGTGWERARTSGMHVGGGALALLVALPVVTRRFAIAPRPMADVCAIAGCLALATYRIGCHLRGCCFGVPSSLPWAVRYDRDTLPFVVHADARLVALDATSSAPVHPLALYFALAAVGIAVGGWLRYARRRYDGEVAIFSLALFSASTIALETLRAEIPGSSSANLTAIAGVLLIASLLLVRVAHGRTAADH